MGEDAIRRVGEAQHVPGDFLDEIGVRRIGREKGDVARELGAHGFEALVLEL